MKVDVSFQKIRFGKRSSNAADNENRIIAHFIGFLINKTGFDVFLNCC